MHWFACCMGMVEGKSGACKQNLLRAVCFTLGERVFSLLGFVVL